MRPAGEKTPRLSAETTVTLYYYLMRPTFVQNYIYGHIYQLRIKLICSGRSIPVVHALRVRRDRVRFPAARPT